MTIDEKATNYCNEMMCTVCSNIRCEYKGKCAEWETRKRYYLAGVEEVKVDCDFTLEGKEVEIMELKQENAELKEQLEKMKCCGNCKYGHCGWSSESIIDGKRQCHAWNKEKEEYCDIGYQGKYQCWELEE